MSASIEHNPSCPGEAACRCGRATPPCDSCTHLWHPEGVCALCPCASVEHVALLPDSSPTWQAPELVNESKAALAEARVLRLAPEPSFRDECTTQVVGLLETLLERAKAGEFKSMVVVVQTEEFYGVEYTACEDIAKRLGMLDLAKHRALMALHEH